MKVNITFESCKDKQVIDQVFRIEEKDGLLIFTRIREGLQVMVISNDVIDLFVEVI